MQKKEAARVCLGFLLTVLIMAGAIALLSVWLSRDSDADELQAGGEAHRVVVIDAGHGGADGGAVAHDGTLEKDINLEIARVLAALMRVSGYKVVMTRERDEMLGQDMTSGSAKMRDLKKRLEIASSYPEALTVSVHCNKFPQESCHGLQVYYGEGAQVAAEAVQNAFSLVDSSNRRKIKKADSSIYLLHRASAPSILVECGFLSNRAELEGLKTEEYRKALALAIFHGASEFYDIQ